MGSCQEYQSTEGAKHPWGSKTTLDMKWDGENYNDRNSSQGYHYTYLKVILAKTTWGVGGERRCFGLLNCLLRKMGLLNCRELVSLSRCASSGTERTCLLPQGVFLLSSSFMHDPASLLNKHWANILKEKNRHWIISCSGHLHITGWQGLGKRNSQISRDSSKQETEA